MPRNSTFHFKQFSIQQDQCSMKICTDACVFGAWIDVSNAVNALDIGTGTGLLTLMLAQKNTELIFDAVEIDKNAAKQAVENANNSIFAQRIQVHEQAIQSFEGKQKYDVIISNPPFFQASLRSPDEKINQAHHAETLRLDELLSVVLTLLKESGRFFILLPPFEMQKFQELAHKKGLFLQKQLSIKHQDQKLIFRVAAAFSFEETAVQAEILSVFLADNHTYSTDFKVLLKDYFVIF